MSRQKGVLEPPAEFVDTALLDLDDAPDVTEDGYTYVRPAFDEEDMLEAVEEPNLSEPQAELPPQEAYDLMKFQAPLSMLEYQILNETPFLGPELSFVDEADRNEWLMNRSKERYAAMDNVLEDEMYGDDELGFSLKKFVRKAGRGISSAARATGRAATKPLGKLVKKFVPGRDAQKAALVKQTNARLINGRAGFLMKQDVARGGAKQPQAYYQQQARAWAQAKLKAGGIPTSYTTGEVASSILGDDVMGSWWNPFSWFQTRTKYVLQNAAGEMAEMSQAQWDAYQGTMAAQQQAAEQQQTDQSQMDPSQQQQMDPSMMDPSQMDPSMMDPNAQYADPNSYSGDDMSDQMDFIVGQQNSFSGFADSILGGARKQISTDQYRRMCLKSAQKATGKTAPTEAELVAAHKRVAAKLSSKGVTVAPPPGTPPDSTSGAWLYKLDPRYWVKSPRERRLIDAEKTNWQKTQDLAKRTGKQKGELDAGRRAMYQAEQAKKAQDESEAIETELKDIEQSVSSGMGGNGSDEYALVVGAAQQGQAEARKNGKRCGALAAKLEAGEKLSPDDLGKLRNCLVMCRNLRKLHDSLHKKATGDRQQATPDSASGYRDDGGAKGTFINGENPAEILGGASSMGGLSKDQWVALTAVAASQPQNLVRFMTASNIKLTAGDLARLRMAAASTKAIMAHPQYGQASIKGDVIGADSILGFSFTGMLKKVVTAPLALAALPAAALTWGATKIIKAPLNLIQYGARKGGWKTPGTGYRAPSPATPGMSPAALSPGAPYAAQAALSPMAPMPTGPDAATQVRLDAARQRRIAAAARSQAAQAQSAVAQRELASAAAAANAEADALEAEAQARSDAEAAADADAGIPPEESSGEGTVTVLGADWFSGAFVGEVDDPKAKKIVEEAQKNTPTGKKIRAGATLYKKAKGGHRPSRIAVSKMQQKAEKGDPQARRDYNAVKAGKIAVHAKGKAQKKIARKSIAEARKKRVAASQRRMEAALANRLAAGTRRRKLAKLAKVERRAARGDKKAKAAIAKTVLKAKRGDKQAKTTVEALRLARHVRTSAKTPQEARRLRAAGKLVKHARKGNKKALRQLALIQAAAKAGNPNAKRAHARLKIAAKVEKTVATGKVTLGTPTVTPHARKEAAQKKYVFLKKRIASGVGTKEEALAASKLGTSLGLKDEAAALALKARGLRSASQPIKDAAAVQAAAEKGNKEAQQAIADTLASAQAGDPKGISSAGKLAAVKAIDTVQKGGTMPSPIAEATGIVERAHAGDPEAKRIVARAGEAAQSGDPRGVEAAVALTAASAVLAATAAKAGASTHWRKKARDARGQGIPPGEEGAAMAELDELTAKVQSGDATWAEGNRARELAMALGQTKRAAKISSMMPPLDIVNPLSSLHSRPLGRIRGMGGLLKESVKALFLATKDPFANYREGVKTRGEEPMIGRVGPARRGSFWSEERSVGPAAASGTDWVAPDWEGAARSQRETYKKALQGDAEAIAKTRVLARNGVKDAQRVLAKIDEGGVGYSKDGTVAPDFALSPREQRIANVLRRAQEEDVDGRNARAIKSIYAKAKIGDKASIKKWTEIENVANKINLSLDS